MAEARQIVFRHKEVVEALLKYHNIHDGIWGLLVRFGIQAANMGVGEKDLMPVAIVPLLEIGLQRLEEESNIAVDAAKVNPEGLPLTPVEAQRGPSGIP